MNDDVRHLRLEEIGPGAFRHDLACWMCQRRPAVYVGYPRWSFAPCWTCQADWARFNPDAWWPLAHRRARRWWQVWKRGTA